MNLDRPARVILLAAALSSLGLGGCAVTAGPPPHPRHDYVIVAPPPPPRVEVIGVAPYPGYVWIGGYWTWHAPSHSHHWVPGRWEAPRPGHYWEPHRWERHGKEWRERPGRWERDDDRRERRGRGDRR
jgi:hypothetical protein